MFNPNNTEADKQWQNELLEGEKLLWTDRAGTGIRFVLRDIILIPLGIIFFTGSLIWEAIVLLGMPFLYKIGFSLIGIPFILLGLYLSIGRFWIDSKRRTKTFYALTPKRVIIKLIGNSTIVEVFNINTLSAMEISEKPDGSGTIKLDSDPAYYSAWKTGYTYRKTAWAIESVQNIRSIYNLILQQQEILNKSALADHLREVALINAQKNESGSSGNL